MKNETNKLKMKRERVNIENLMHFLFASGISSLPTSFQLYLHTIEIIVPMQSLED